MSTAPAFQASDSFKPLAFDPGGVNGLSEYLIRTHRENKGQTQGVWQ